MLAPQDLVVAVVVLVVFDNLFLILPQEVFLFLLKDTQLRLEQVVLELVKILKVIMVVIQFFHLSHPLVVAVVEEM
jgi:hypothetical protein